MIEKSIFAGRLLVDFKIQKVNKMYNFNRKEKNTLPSKDGKWTLKIRWTKAS